MTRYQIALMANGCDPYAVAVLGQLDEFQRQELAERAVVMSAQLYAAEQAADAEFNVLEFADRRGE